MDERETIEAIIASLRESEPFDGEYGNCTICLNDPPNIGVTSYEDVSWHKPTCAWRLAKELRERLQRRLKEDKVILEKLAKR
jgi:hypothetical protein